MTLAVDLRTRLSPQFLLDAAFTVPPGITILFGASGSGKTTVLRSVSGLVRPESGRIAVGDRTLFDSAAGIDVPVQQRRVGYVFQQLALFPHLTVGQNIAYGLAALPVAERQRRVEAIARTFHITPLLDRKADRVSGGERQRAALARSLVADPSILLLDEPLSALDHAIQSRIMDDLRRWNDEHRIPILYVTHGHREVFALGERVVVLEAGHVMAVGSPHEVLEHPEQHSLATLAGFENVLEATVVGRREAAGTMQCRVGHQATELEVPLGRATTGSHVRVAIRAGDILVANQAPQGLSARNVLIGHLQSLVAQGPTIVATVDAAGLSFVVHLTPGGVEALQLRAGDRVWLIIKTYSCRLLT